MQRLRFGAGFALAVGLLYLTLRQVDLGELWTTIREADLGLVIAATAASIITMAYRAVRWRVLAMPVATLPLPSMVACTFMGWSTTVLLPGRVGEVVKPLLLARREGISRSSLLATVVVERVLDVAVLVVMLASYLALMPIPRVTDGTGRELVAALRVVGVTGIAGVTLGVAIVALGVRYPDRGRAVLGSLFSRLPERLSPRVSAIADAFLRGFGALRNTRLLLLVLLHSVGIWSLILLTYMLMGEAFDLALPPYAMVPVVAIGALGAVVPTPGAVGSYHKAVQVALAGLWGIAMAPATGFAIVAHAVGFLPPAAIGLVLLAREGVTISAARRLDEDASTRP